MLATRVLPKKRNPPFFFATVTVVRLHKSAQPFGFQVVDPTGARHFRRDTRFPASDGMSVGRCDRGLSYDAEAWRYVRGGSDYGDATRWSQAYK